MAIETRTLTPGTQLTARYRKQIHTCTVEQNEDGTVAHVLGDGRRFKSPSAAGSAVMGGIACNGWRFWSVADAAAPPAPLAKAAKAATGTGGRRRSTPLLKPLDDQSAAPAGMRQWWCSGCMNGFDAPAEDTPAACPAGHGDQPAS